MQFRTWFTTRSRDVRRALLMLGALAVACTDASAPTGPTPTTGVQGDATGGTRSVSVTPSTLSLDVGQSAALTATVRDRRGRVIRSATVMWASAAPAIATVSATGQVTGVGGGATTITATSGGATATVTVQVLATATLQEIAITPATVTMDAGTTQTFTASARWSDGRTTVPTLSYSIVGGGSINATTGVFTAPSTAGTTLVIVAPQGSLLRDTAVVTVVVPPTPPSPTGGFTPNEPSGMTRHVEPSFTSSLPFDPGPYGSSVGYSDPTAPFTASSVARFVYPAGPAAGFYTGGYYPPTLPAGTVRLYVAFNWRLSPNFTLNPANLKGWYLYRNSDGTSGSLVLGWMPTSGSLSSGGFELNGQPQTSAGPGIMAHNQPGAPTLVRGQWYHTEMLLVMNSASTVSDGIFRVWVNGVLTINYTNVRFSENGQALSWSLTNLDPYYGGNTPGHTIPETSYLYIDHAVVSRSSSRQ